MIARVPHLLEVSDAAASDAAEGELTHAGP
jgi:hypothetical protein